MYGAAKNNSHITLQRFQLLCAVSTADDRYTMYAVQNLHGGYKLIETSTSASKYTILYASLFTINGRTRSSVTAEKQRVSCPH